MNTAIELLKTIGKDNIDINSKSLISSGLLDSLDIMALVDAIEEKFNKSLDADFIEKNNFESIEAIENMLNKAFRKKG
ncbi:hypothetical protein CHL_1443 [Campylobacter hyointestinalis subsp. lawsonii CCUG 27631]|uniref:phosphopantetheine-binding protein n=1 Tax=Campylobacter hyointestinalis TaxID=198 RepID=UPI0007C904A5|nr:phosphopantetheine-binding protein [Campylobacter hyointestinalis]ANE34755.1 hypothetical protein CHL_1443 [Campylobacter hyointestinalis subsp. lawsonii CCUG 27631]